jgi:hypothetical protein
MIHFLPPIYNPLLNFCWHPITKDDKGSVGYRLGVIDWGES